MFQHQDTRSHNFRSVLCREPLNLELTCMSTFTSRSMFLEMGGGWGLNSMVQLQHIQSHKDLFTWLLSFKTGATSPCTYMYVHIHQQIQVFRNWVHKHIRDFIRSVCTIYGGHGKNLMKVKYLGRKRGGACIPEPPDLPLISYFLSTHILTDINNVHLPFIQCNQHTT